MRIERIPIEKINIAPYNPRLDLKPDDKEYKDLKRSINEFGNVEIGVWNERSSNLVAGHQRIKIEIERGAKDFECRVVDLDDVREKALNLALNKIRGDWDFAKLADVLMDIDTGDFNVDITGFDEEEREQIATWTPPQDKDSEGGGKERKEIICPSCGHIF